MRYGGYVLIGLPMILFSSSIISRLDISKKHIANITLVFIVLSIVIFNFRNLLRIDKEIKVYGYEPFESPYFFTDNVNSKVILETDNIIIYSPIENTCWASKTPCSYNPNLKSDKFLWMDMVSRK
tara:strand:- start:165 stop:539 length:375 start_codon:yes stop_codon:yes gene_type:complete